MSNPSTPTGTVAPSGGVGNVAGSVATTLARVVLPGAAIVTYGPALLGSDVTFAWLASGTPSWLPSPPFGPAFSVAGVTPSASSACPHVPALPRNVQSNVEPGVTVMCTGGVIVSTGKPGPCAPTMSYSPTGTRGSVPWPVGVSTG